MDGEALDEHVSLLDCLYLFILGRNLENRGNAESTFGLTPSAILANLIASEEFKVRVAEPLLQGRHPDPSWISGSQADPRLAEFLTQAGARDVAFLKLDSALARLAGLLSIPAAQSALGRSLGKDAAARIVDTLSRGALADEAPPVVEDPSPRPPHRRLSQSADIKNAYLLILARDPEIGASTDPARLGLALGDLLRGFIESAEFTMKFVTPRLRNAPAAAAYYRSISPELRTWALDLGVAQSTRGKIADADMIGEVVDLLLRDDLVQGGEASGDLAAYRDQIAQTPSSWRELIRPELVRLNLSNFPKGFNWNAYLQHNPTAGRTRWDALVHLLDQTHPPSTLPPAFDDGKADFFAALATAFVGDKTEAQYRYAALLLQAAAHIRPLTPVELESLGDALIELKLPYQALETYLKVDDARRPSFGLLRKAAEAAISIHAHDDAIAILRKIKASFGAQPPFKTLLLAYFESRLRTAADLAYAGYRQGDRPSGDNALLGLIDDLEAQFLELSPLGAPLPADGLKRVLVFADVGLPQCKHYRVDQKIAELTALGFKPELFKIGEHEAVIERLPGAEALIVYRYPAWPTVLVSILTARSLGVPTFFEIDDLLFDAQEYPDSYASYGGQITFSTYVNLQFGVPLFRAAARLCDYAIASTEPLAGELRKIVRSGQGWVVPNSLDHRIEHIAAMGASAANDVVTIFYGTGTRAHNSDFDDLVAPALLDILAKYPQVRLLIVGYLTLQAEFDPYLNRIIRMDFVEPVDSYWRLLASADINIAVLNPSLMADCKSEIKWLEAAAFAIPSVVSPTAAFRLALTDDQDVLFAATPGDWFAAFERLIEDPALRRRLGETAKAKAHERFSQPAAARVLAGALDDARSKRAPVSAKPKLMFVNVYFPPQTIGGATRVLKDNIDAFIDLGLCEDFDLAVLTTDAGVQPPGKLSVESYRGLPVFRISTPGEMNMDWRPSNPAIGAIFARIYDLWRPDLVHFHCVQRLTGSVVDICRRNYTPYLITAHDAWWISDYQFLTDETNQIVDAGLDAPQPPPPTGVTEVQSHQRALYLKSLLGGAQAVLAVSKAFSDVYRSAGVGNVKAVPNGLPRLDMKPRQPSKDGRVRLAHVGNVTTHKGFPLVRRALMEGRFPNLRLTAVDHGFRPGDSRTEVWGETEVQIVGPSPQDAMPSFYAEHDVLLAPSIWPESFGLVTREALAAGLWVVASDRGAIGEDVTPGVNGFIVDVASHLPLQETLAYIDANAKTFLTSPPPTRLRSSEDQAKELIAIYRELIAATSSQRDAAATPGVSLARPPPAG